MAMRKRVLALCGAAVLCTCAGRSVKPSAARARSVVVCEQSCGANFDALARGEAGVFVQDDAGKMTHGELTEAGEERVRMLRELFAGLSLRKKYGCPGCDGRRSAWVELAGARHEYEPGSLDESASDVEREALTEAFYFVETIRKSVARCESNEWITIKGDCKPYPEPPDNRERTILEKLGPVDPAARDTAEDTEPGPPRQ